MQGLMTVFWKELADNFNSWRFIILFILAFAVSIFAIYIDAQYIRQEVTETRFVFLQLYTTSGSVYTRWRKPSPQREIAFSMRVISIISMPI
ncbi:hypothetical protein ES703_106141 [subsurface metagenome]